MIGDHLQRLISIFSNGFVSFPSLIAMLMTGTLLVTQFRTLSTTARNLCAGLFLQSAGEMVRIGYWFPAIWLSREGHHYHPWFIEHRFLSYGLSLPFLVIGTWLILRQLFPKRRRLIHVGFFAGFVIAFALTAVFHASEIGLWDRSFVVNWFDNTFHPDANYLREE